MSKIRNTLSCERVNLRDEPREISQNIFYVPLMLDTTSYPIIILYVVKHLQKLGNTIGITMNDAGLDASY